jgi:four helix bundle protein
MNNFRELVVWQKSIEFVVKIYEITRHFPKEEKFNLISQMQRSATSIPSNIAEGAGRNTNPLFKHFYFFKAIAQFT